MLSLSSRTHYAALAIAHLARQYKYEGLTKAADIARNEGMPQSYLEQLMSRLCKAGLVNSYRGAQGGYRLAREPKLITLRDVIEAVDGSVRLRPDEPSSLNEVWKTLSGRVGGVLEVTLPDLLKMMS